MVRVFELHHNGLLVFAIDSDGLTSSFIYIGSPVAQEANDDLLIDRSGAYFGEPKD